MRLVLLGGLAGSGKSTALDALEDLNFYCVDNLPVTLLLPFIDTLSQRQLTQAAIGLDTGRLPEELALLVAMVGALKGRGLTMEIVFLTARDDIVLQRYSETRRPHPLSEQCASLAEAIALERERLSGLAELADLVIDTSQNNVHELRNLIKLRLQPHAPQGPQLALQFESFAFKHGVPADADFVFDVRCLPNPHWVPRLRGMTGRDSAVIAFLEEHDLVIQLRDDLQQFLHRWVNAFAQSDRSYLTVAIGCTGGQHRSVYLAEQLARQFVDRYPQVTIRHRELVNRH